ncbi:hypothetical protein CPB86DRAFT_701576 [Serendipita vermifera]|nr:hypothetical protein CPB86DRAFT_701576 [Serendipita vermifera]
MRTKRRNALKKGNNAKNSNKSSSIARWDRRQDIELDEEDAFHENRDKIMLENDDKEVSDDELKNEVFALNKLKEYSEEDSEEMEEEESVPSHSRPTKGKKDKKNKNSSEKPTLSDATAPSESSDLDEPLESWGRNKSAYYSTNAADIDSDDEETQRLEEAEAIKLQKQARAALREDDFGIHDSQRQNVTMDGEQEEPSIISIPKDPEGIVRHLEKTSPETLALAREWEDVVYDISRSQQAVDSQDPATASSAAAGMLQLYHQTLLTYGTTLAFYFYLRATPKYATNPKLLQSHPVMSRLLTLKQAMSSLERLDFGPNSDTDDLDDEEDDEDEDEEDNDELDEAEEVYGPGIKSPWGSISYLTNDDLKDWLRVAEADKDSDPPDSSIGKETLFNGTSKKSKHDKDRKGKEKRDAIQDQIAQESKKRKKKKGPKFDLEEPEFIPHSKKSVGNTKHIMPSSSVSAFGEQTSLNHIDSQDKSVRKKSLQFHTSRIENTSAKRIKARGVAMGGDEDIPYRERDKERELRLHRESSKRQAMLGQGGEDLEDISHNKLKRPREDEESMEMEVDGYYDLVKRQKREIKEEKKFKYDTEKAEEKAAREGYLEEDADGPRSLTRAILKNKGLTPTRSKTIRNPRVKKRLKYDDAKKKIRSQKAVFKGGLATTGGRYEGETSGISTKVIKSVKLG